MLSDNLDPHLIYCSVLNTVRCSNTNLCLKTNNWHPKPFERSSNKIVNYGVPQGYVLSFIKLQFKFLFNYVTKKKPSKSLDDRFSLMDISIFRSINKSETLIIKCHMVLPLKH